MTAFRAQIKVAGAGGAGSILSFEVGAGGGEIGCQRLRVRLGGGRVVFV